MAQGPNWDGLLKWSIANSDGTNPPRQLSDDDRKWFMEAMQSQTVDVIKRMKEISLVMQTPEQVLESQGVTPQDLEDLLDELQEHVESIDNANDLHSIGGLVPLLNYLKNSHANIRAKASEVISTIVQNNPKSQQLVMEANGFEPLFANFTSDPDVTVRTKALGAISSLIRNNKAGISAFRLANGYKGLKDALSSENERFQRKALNLIDSLLYENHSDCNIITELGFPRIFIHLASSSDSEIREGALKGILALAHEKKAQAQDQAQGGEDDEVDEKLKKILEERVNEITKMSSEDLSAAKEERQLVDMLWSVSFDEPSALREKGLVFIEGEDGPAPDVVGKLFEPPLRGFSGGPGIEKTEKKDAPPLLLGLGPPQP